MNIKKLESYISTLDFISSRTKYSYRDGYELNLRNEENSKINGSVVFRLGIGESEVVLFDCQFSQLENSIIFNTRYHFKNFRTRHKPNFMGNGEYTAETETQQFEETDVFMVLTRNKKGIFDSPNRYLIHIVNGVPHAAYLVDKRYKLADGIRSELTPHYFDNQVANVEYNQVEEFIGRKK